MVQLSDFDLANNNKTEMFCLDFIDFDMRLDNTNNKCTSRKPGTQLTE